MSNIGQIQATIMRFNQKIEEELFRMAKHSGISFSYYYGYIMEFDKANVDGIIPHTLIFSKKGKQLIVNNGTRLKIKKDLIHLIGQNKNP